MDLAAIASLRAALWQGHYRPIPLLTHTDPDRARAGKAPLHKDWPARARRNPPEAAVTPAQAHLTNTGILADTLRALDVDVDDFGRADAIEQLAIRMLGPAPTRRRDNANRFLMLYRAAEGEPRKRKLDGTTGDPANPDKIEVLGKGQQFVAYGTHATGGNIYWTGPEPLDMPVDRLPAVTEAQIEVFLAECAKIIGAPERSKARGNDDGRKPSQGNGTVDPAELAKLVSALNALPAELADNYDTWILIGCALHQTTHGTLAGRDIWDTWSKQSDKYDAGEIDRRWVSFADTTGDPVSAGTIYHLARQQGWSFPGVKPLPQPGGWPDPVDVFTPMNTSAAEVTEDEAPPALWPFIKDTAERMGVATSSVTLAAIVTCSAVISDEWRLQPKRHDYSWTECARLWGAIVGPPSTLKTPVISACTRPVNQLEAAARRQWQKDMRRYQAQLAEWKKNGGDADDEPQEPKIPRWLVENTTIEALQEVLRDDEGARFTAQAKKVLIRQDELSEFLANLDRYSSGRQGGDRGAYLRLYNGGAFSVDRIVRGSFTASNWSGCLLGGIQPEPIQRIAKQTVDDGLLQRFIYDVPAPQSQRGVDRKPDQDAIDRYQRLIPALTALHPARSSERAANAVPRIGGVRDAHAILSQQVGAWKSAASDRDQAAVNVALHSDAHEHREAIDELARNMAAMPDTSTRLQSAFDKWRGLFARLCLTFHLIEIADARASNNIGPPLDVVSADTAERVAGYMRRVLLPHLLRAEALMFATVQTGHARWVAGHILANRLDCITVRDVYRNYAALSAPESRQDLLNVMASLASIGWLDAEEPHNPLNPVSSWRVNPLIHGMFAERAGQERQERKQRQEETIARRQAHTDATR
jgi:hypothetical protein